MEIQHSVKINASVERIWDVMLDISCWNDWNTVAQDARSESGRLTKGKRFEFCIRPFVIPLNIKPVVEKLEPGKHIIWSGSKFGIEARHEFIFEKNDETVKIISRETLTGRALQSLMVKFTQKSLTRLSIKMLRQLKEAAENGTGS